MMNIYFLIIGIQLVAIVVLVYFFLKSRQGLKFFTSILDSLPTGICTVGVDLTVHYGNKAILDYYQVPEDFKGTIKYRDVLDDSLIDLIENELKAKQGRACYFEGCAAPGSYEPLTNYIEGYHWFRCHYIPVLDKDGKVMFYVVYNENRTTEKEAEYHLMRQKEVVEQQLNEIEELNKELLAANKNLENFAAMASHDLKAPLNTICGFSEFMVEKYKNVIQEKDIEVFAIMNKAGERMKRLIDDLLLFSRIGKQPKLETKAVDLGKIMENLLNENRAYFREKGVKVHYEKLPVIDGNESLLYQVFQNLVLNSVKYSKHDEKPLIKICSLERGKEVEISIQDNGIGIPDNQLKRVLEPFVKLHSQTEYEGSGLGLYTCAKIVKFHGGKISVESKENVGTTVKIAFPSRVA